MNSNSSAKKNSNQEQATADMLHQVSQSALNFSSWDGSKWPMMRLPAAFISVTTLPQTQRAGASEWTTGWEERHPSRPPTRSWNEPPGLSSLKSLIHLILVFSHKTALMCFNCFPPSVLFYTHSHFHNRWRVSCRGGLSFVLERNQHDVEVRRIRWEGQHEDEGWPSTF